MTPPGLVGVPCEEWLWSESFASFMKLRLPERSLVQVLTDTTTPLAEKRDELAEITLEVPAFRWLLFLDSDQTFPHDVAQRLWRTAEETGAGVVSAPIVRRSKWEVHVRGRIHAWRLEEGFRAEYPERVADDPGIEAASEQVQAAEVDRNGEPFDVDLVGAGCTLIRKEALEAVGGPPWFVPNKVEQPGRSADVNFVHRAKPAGFRVVVDPRVRGRARRALRLPGRGQWFAPSAPNTGVALATGCKSGERWRNQRVQQRKLRATS